MGERDGDNALGIQIAVLRTGLKQHEITAFRSSFDTALGKVMDV